MARTDPAQSPDNPRARALLAETYLELARLARDHGSPGELVVWLQECRRLDVEGKMRDQIEKLRSGRMR